MSAARTRLLICGILGVAAAARLWGIGFGLPHPNARPDEGGIAAISGGLFYGDVNPHNFNYPALFPLVVAGTLRLLATGVALLRSLHVPMSLDVLATPVSYMTARLWSAAAGTASVWVLFRSTERLLGRDTALAAAALLALAFLHVRDSHFGVTDVAMTFMVLVAFLWVVRLSSSGSRRDAIGAGVMAGLATSVKYNAVLMAVPAAVVIASAPGRVMGPLLARWRLLAWFGLFMVAAFLITSPYTVLDFQHFFADVAYESRHLAEGHGPDLGRGWTYHFTTTLRYGVGAPVLAAGLLGLVLLSWRNPRTGAIVALFPVTYYLVLGSGRTVFARYMLPVVPFLCLAAGYAATEAGRRLTGRIGRPTWAPIASACVVAALLLPSARSVLAFDRLMARTDSRVLARRWVEARFPPGTTIAQVGWESGHPFLQDSSEVKYRGLPFLPDATLPDLVIVQSSVVETPAVDLGGSEAILDTAYELRYVRDVSSADPANVYDRQDEFYLPLAGFEGIDRPGPNLRIYVRREMSASRPSSVDR